MKQNALNSPFSYLYPRPDTCSQRTSFCTSPLQGDFWGEIDQMPIAFSDNICYIKFAVDRAALVRFVWWLRSPVGCIHPQ
jgi:hypothetical protein